MEWQDQGVLLSVRRHGESAAIIEVLSEHHGRHAGLVRGGGARKNAALLQTGTQLSLTWRARLEDQLGSFTVELLRSRAAALLADRQKLYAFNAISAMFVRYLPEREPNRDLYNGFIDLLTRLQGDDFWQHRFCRLELELLESLGYGVDLSSCAVSGQTDDLTHVSPKSGRAVSRESAHGWEDRLLQYPAFLQQETLARITPAEFKASLLLSGHFFEKWIPSSPAGLPESRRRLLEVV